MSWEPSNQDVLRYRIKWFEGGRTRRKYFPATDEGLLKLYQFYIEKEFGLFECTLEYQVDMSYHHQGAKAWFRFPYALQISAVIHYLATKGLLKKGGEGR